MRRPDLRAWLRAHARTAVAAAGELSRARLGTALSALVLGITLTLPALGVLAVEALARATAGLDARPQLSAYLRVGTPDAVARKLTATVRAWPEVADARLISAAQARAEFAASSDLGPLLGLVDDNPLPASVVVHPAIAPGAGADLAALSARLAALDGVEHVQSDLEWVARLHAALALGRRAIGLLALLLGAGVVLVTGNTIRLAILSRREEIEILKLVGGTDAFVRRPFLYSGLLQGLAGGAVAIVLVGVARQVLAGPGAELARLYGQTTALPGLGAARALILLGIGAALGLAGAWLAVTRHLHEIEPR